jgi:hypothetical protein
MELNIITDNIKSKLIQQGLTKYIADIDNCIASGSTGGEITSMVGSYLINLKVNDKNIAELIGQEIDEYNDECKRIGIFLK